MARILPQTRVKNGACINYVSLTVSSNGIGGSNCVVEIEKITTSMTFLRNPDTHKHLPGKIITENIGKLIVRGNEKEGTIIFNLYSRQPLAAARKQLEEEADAYIAKRSTYYADLLKQLAVFRREQRKNT